MAKIIKLTSSVKEEILEEIMTKLATEKLGFEGFKYEKPFKYTKKKTAQVFYTQKAWFKTLMLVDTQSEEVGWHGLCYRDEEDPTVFKVTDIIVYPQKVTGTTIDPDAIEYTKWMDELSDDVFNHLRMHGHSHVNMGVFSSATDEGFRNDRLTQLKDDDFYVFQVFNKQGAIHSAIYDYRENILYENEDVETLVECEDIKIWDKYKKVARLLMDVGTDVLGDAMVLYSNAGIEKFLSESKSKVVSAEVLKYPTMETHPPLSTYKKKKGSGTKAGTFSYDEWRRRYYDPYGYDY